MILCWRRLVRMVLPALVALESLPAGPAQAAVRVDPPATPQVAAVQPGQPATTEIVIPARIAVLDTGIDASHPDLAGKVVGGRSFTGGDPLTDPNGHGTALASIALANGQAAPGQAELLSVQVLGPDGKAQDSDVIAGIRWAADNRANVILMGFSSPDFSELVAKAISNARKNGAVIVAAAGNDGSAEARYPAAMDHVIGVAALDEDGRVAAGSNTASASVAAPGTNILAAAPGGGQQRISGTSPAAAYVAGLAARLLFAGQDNDAASKQLRGATDALDGVSFGRVSLVKALGPLVGSAPVAAASLLRGPPAVNPPVYVANADGSGSATISPTTVYTSTGGDYLMTITFTATENMTNAAVRVTIPTGSGWTPNPTTANGSGEFTAVNGTCTGTPTVATGGANATVSGVTCATGQTLILTYQGHDTSAGTATFTVATDSPTANGSFANIASSPTVTTNAVGTGTVDVRASCNAGAVNGPGYDWTCTVTVLGLNPPGTPTGTVTFNNFGIGSMSANPWVATLSGGSATVVVNHNHNGGFPHNFNWAYSGDGTYGGGTSNTLTINSNAPMGASQSSMSAVSGTGTYGSTATLTATLTATSGGAAISGKTITFYRNGTSVGTATTNASGVATLSGVSLAGINAGSYSNAVVAVFAGDASWQPANGSGTLVVNKASTTTTVTSGTNPSVYGQSVTFTATVSSAGGTPTGTANFKDGGATITGCGAQALNGSGQATCATSSLSAGTHSITVDYSGDTNFSTSSSATLTQTVNKAATTTTVTSSVNPSVFGQSVTFTATTAAVAPGAGTPTGTANFKDGGTTITGCGAQALNGSAQAICSTSSLSVGSHSITVDYSGDGNFNSSSSATLTQTVNKAATTTTVTSSVNPSVFGQSVTFTATVAAVAPGAGTPTGTANFKDGASSIAGCGAQPLNGTAQAACSTSSLSVGSHSITVVYSGDGNFTTSTSAVLTQTVNQASTTTTVSSSANPSVFGQSVTFTATVTANLPGAGTPTGTANFKDGGATITGCGAQALNGSGQATCSTSSLSVGSHSITAAYGGDTNFTASTSAALSQTVNQASTSVALSSSANPSVFGQTVTFTATVTANLPGAGTPTGTVTVKDGATTLGTCTLSAGSCTYATSSLAVGSHSITASYGGDTNFTASTSSTLTQTVNQDSTATTVSSSANPSVVGQSVTFTATVSANAPGSGTPTGTVTIKDGATTLGTCTLSAGSCTYATSSLALGSHSITAVYGGDTNFTTSTSATLTQTVNQAGTSTSLSSSANPSVVGQSVTFTATVNVSVPGSGTPTGTVNFKDGATTITGCGAQTLNGSAQATCTTSSLTLGSHSITAVYSGDTNFLTSTSAVLTQTVNQASTSTTVVADVNPSVFGQMVTFTATVSATAPASGTPTGSVNFKDGASSITGCSAQSLTAGSATCSIATLSVGSHSITAVYSGDTNYAASTSAVLTQTVNKASTSVSVASSANPSKFGQSVTFTATVSVTAPGSTAGGNPTGNLTFTIDGTAQAPSAVSTSGGVTTATFTTATLSVGSHTVSAVYNGDGSFNASSSASLSGGQTVNKADTSLSVASSVNPSVFGQSVTFTATVSVTAPGSNAAANPTGNVTFTIDGTAQTPSSVSTSGGVTTATFTTATLSVGSHTVSAVYNGDGNFNASSSASLSGGQTVNKAGTTTTVSSSVNPSTFGQSVTFTATVAAVAPGLGTPSGTATFKDGGTSIGTCTLSGGSCTFSTSSLSIGSHSITVDYGGDGSFNTSSSATLTQTVNKTGTTSTLTSSVNPSKFGQSVTFTVTVTSNSGGGTPTGNVTFKDGATSLNTTALNGSGQATYTTATLSVGTHTITVDYAGDTNFNTSTSNTVSQVVQAADTTTTVSTSLTPSVFGQSVTFTATISITSPGTNAAANPSGTVTFKDGATSVGTGTVSTSGGVTTATFSTSSLAVGTHTITAVYGGDGSFNGSTSAVLTQTVNKADTTTSLTSSANPSVFGQSITFTATVAAVAPGAGTPSGTVTIKDAGTSIGTCTLSGGSCTFSTSSLAVGTHPITADYGGDGSFNTSSSSSVSQVVNKASTSTSLSSSANPSVFGQSVTFTATVNVTVPGAGSPTGTVDFLDGATAVCSGVSLSAGSATCSTSSLSVGSHSMTAVYSGDGSFNGSTSAVLTQTVNKAGTATTLTSSQNPSVFGQSVTFTATVSATGSGSGTPTGTITFRDGGTSIGTCTLSGGGCTLSTSSLAVGSHTMTADYGGDGSFNTSTSSSLTQTVNKASTTTTLTSSVNPSNFGQSVTFTATVTAVLPGAGTPTGTVTIKDAGTTIGTCTLSAGSCTFSTSSLAVGSHTITADYGGDGSFNASSSAALTQTVNKTNTTSTLTSAPNPSVYGQSVTFTVTVTSNSGGGTPSGTMTFKDGATTIGSCTLSGGACSISTSTLSVTGSPHSITADYGGDSSFNTSTSNTVSQVVNKASTTTAVSSSVNPSVYGQSVTFTATVSITLPGTNAAADPSGTVDFQDGGATIGTGTLSTSGGVTTATFTTSSLTVGTHPITAVYNGDSSFNGSTSSSLSQVVNKASTSTTVSSSSNPSKFGESVTFTATVSASGAGSGTPTGTVTFKDGAATIGSCTLTAGSCTMSTAALTVATHSITAAYSGDGNFNTSTSAALSQVVSKADTATSVTSNSALVPVGATVTFTATITVSSPGSTTVAYPTGTVTFKDAGTTIGTGTVSTSGGVTTATFSTSSLALGSHDITAVYNGDGNFNPSTSAIYTQAIGKANTTTTVTSSPNPSVFGQSVTFTATVTVNAPGSGTPTGTIDFKDGGSSIGGCSGQALNGSAQATCTTSSLSVGSHTITAVYGGDSDYNGSTSSAYTHTVNKAGTTTTVTSNQNPSVYGQSVTFTATVSAAAPGSGTPTGSVDFVDGATTLSTVALAGGSATYSTSSLAVGTHSITAVYAGDGNFNGSTSSVLSQVVNQASTATALTSSQNPSVFGQSVTFTATVTAVAPGAGTPTGSVNFKDGASSITGCGAQALSAGSATCTTNALGVGTHTITAVYGGDTNFSGSTSAALSQVVNKADTSTSLSSSANPSVFGQSVTFTATVNVTLPGTTAIASPSGNVTFKDGATTICAAAALSGATATCSTATLSVGSHSITATYNGDSNFNASTSAALTQTVNQAATSTAVTSSANPSDYGQSVTFTATVGITAPGSNAGGDPTGTVTFKDGATTIGTGTLSTSGGVTTATFSTSSLAIGSHSITAVYAGDTNFTGSTSAVLTQTVNKTATTSTLTSSQNPSVFGQSVTFTVTVTSNSGGGTPTGSVTFNDGATTLTTTTLNGSSQASYTTATLSVGTHNITVDYAGDTNFNASTSNTVAQVVNAASTTTTLASNQNPSVYGQSVTFTATLSVTAPGTAAAAFPSGTVDFKDGATTIGTGSVSTTAGVTTATFTTSSLTVGTHSMTAVYNGDGSFNGSTSAVLSQVVNLASTTTSLASNANPSVFGQSVTFTATVAVVAPGAGSPTGTVAFKDGATTLSTQTLSAGSATFSTSSLSVGTHTMTAAYSGDSNFAASTSSALSQVVNKADTSGALTASPNPSVFGQSVTFTVTVTASSPGAGLPAGNVDFKDGATILNTTALNASGQATFSTSALAVGTHTMTVDYAGDGNFNASTSNSVSQVVNKANTTTSLSADVNPAFVGQTVTFTATVAAVGPGAGTPTGTVTFKDGATSIGACTLAAGTCSFATSSLTLAGSPHSITAVYGGDGNFNGSTSNAVSESIIRAPTTTTLTSSSNPSKFGETVTFTATVTVNPPASGTPTGSVDFKDGATLLSTVSLTAGSASYSTNTLSVGTHTITADYSGDTNYDVSTGTVSQVVEKADTSTSVASSVNPSVFGQSVTFTATIAVAAPGTTAVAYPGGTVTFNDGATTLGTGSVSTTAGVTTATYTTSTLAVGSHSITAVYGGNSNFNGSTSPGLTQTVNKADTGAALTSSANPSKFGQNVTFTATVAAVLPGAGTPTGTVDFQDGGVSLAGCGAVTLAAASATCSTNQLSVGTHNMTAVYSGDANFNADTSSALSQVVQPANTTTSVTSAPNPSIIGQSATFTATVSVSSPGTTAVANPTGTVTFYDGGTAIGTGTLSTAAGVTTATFSTSALTLGSHSITASYATDGNFAGSTSAAYTHTVNKGSTTTTLALTSGATPASYGQSLTFTATVGAVAPASGTPTGTVDFKDGATTIASCTAVALVGGTAACTISTLSPGTHSLTAVYSGDANFYASTSSALSQVVNKASTTVAVTSSSNPSVYSGAVTFMATITVVAPGAGTPTGTVNFKDGATSIGACSAQAVNGSLQATCTTSALSGGSHTITAVYSGDANYNTSTSPSLTQTVTKADTTTTLTSSAGTTTYGQSVTFTATVSPVAPATGTRTGTVTFKDGATTLGTATINASGVATYTTTTLSAVASPHSVTATYNGDTNFNTSTSGSVTQTVNKANLAIAARNQSIKQGDAIPAPSVVYNGLVNGDSVSATFAVCCGITSASAVGQYDHAYQLTSGPSGANIGNYNVTINGGAAPGPAETFTAGTVACPAGDDGCLQIKYNDITPPTATVTTTKLMCSSSSILYYTYKFTFNAVDNTGGSGVAFLAYYTTGAWVQGSSASPITVAASGGVVSNYTIQIPGANKGTTTVTYWAVDNSNNKQAAQQNTVTTNPTVPPGGGCP